MASTYVNALRLNEMGTGDESGSWGTVTNLNLDMIGEAFGYGAEAIADASTHTITMADGAVDEARNLYLKCTGGGQACTVTLAPNTVSKIWILENATSYTLTFSQGSGANVVIPASDVKVIATDGAGSGAVVYDLFVDLNIATKLTVKNPATSASPATLLLQSGDTDIAAADVLGKIQFQAPDEAAGTDAILVAAAIEAVSEGDFSSSNNATKLSFKTGNSEAATEKMSISAVGKVELAGTLRQKLGADVASNAALPVNVAGNMFDVTGTTTVTSLNTKGVGTIIVLQFDGAVKLTHHATNLIMPGAFDYTTAAGDILTFYEYASADWRCISALAATGAPSRLTTPLFFTASGTWTKPLNLDYIEVAVVGGGGGGGGGASTTSNGGTGGTTIFDTVSGAVQATGGGGGIHGGGSPARSGGTPGTGSGGTVNLAGGGGGGAGAAVGGGTGGNSYFGGGARGMAGATVGSANTGGGGAGGAGTGAAGAGGGGSGGYSYARIADSDLAATEAVTIGAGGTAGSGTALGGVGGAGVCVVKEYTF